jgi:hypothetical protein
MLPGEMPRHQGVGDRGGVPLAAEFAVGVRQRAAKPQERRVLVHRAPDGVLELREATVGAAQHEERQPLSDEDVPALGPLAEGQRLEDQLLCLLETPFHQREHGATGAHVPALGAG